MASKKTLAQRLFNISKISNKGLTNCRISTSTAQFPIPSSTNQESIAPDPGDNGIFRRFLPKRVIPTELPALPIGGNLMEKLKSMSIGYDRIRLDGLAPPPVQASPEARIGLTVQEAKKLLRVAQLEVVKSRLRVMEKSWISYSEFVRICGDGCLNLDEGRSVAKMLDESGTVIVLGNAVFLKPELVAKALQELIPAPEANPNDPRRRELEELEKKKAQIDAKADLLVRRELWGGLAYLLVQTAAFMRLTFWELSWDVMEPICFYVTSVYFMAGYAFFLRTSKEPSFEGFFQSRFSSKQKRLMKLENFDIGRYNELRKAFQPPSPKPPLPSISSSSFDKLEKLQLGVINH